MPVRKTLLILMLIIPIITACSAGNGYKAGHQGDQAEARALPSEKAFYKESDAGTEVFRMTSDQGNDSIFYQEPNYFSPDSSKFLFKSQRGDGKERLYLMDISSGEITLLMKSDSYGHIPTWSSDGKEIFIGNYGKITVIDTATFQERHIELPEKSWITFLHTNPSGNKILFVEEGTEDHKGLSIINTDGTGFRRLFTADHDSVFFIDHPAFIDDSQILFLTRGRNRNFSNEYNQPYIKNITNLEGNQRRLPVECSHYDVNPKGNKILCGSEGYIVDLKGNLLKNFSEIRGHGAWAPDGDTFLMTPDPVPVPSGPFFGEIALMKLSSDEKYSLVSHESTYDSLLAKHIQPNAQFSRDGRYVIYESDMGHATDSNLYLVEVPE